MEKPVYIVQLEIKEAIYDTDEQEYISTTKPNFTRSFFDNYEEAEQYYRKLFQMSIWLTEARHPNREEKH